MNRMRLLMLFAMLHIVQPMFATQAVGANQILVWNRSNMPITICYTTDKVVRQYSNQIAPGVQTVVSYLGNLKGCRVYPLLNGQTVVAGSTLNQSQLQPECQLATDGVQFGIGGLTSNKGDKNLGDQWIAKYIIFYGDAATQAGTVTTQAMTAAVASKDIGALAPGTTTGQYLLPIGSLSRFALIKTVGPVTAGSETAGAAQQNAYVQTYDAQQKLIEIPAPTA